MLLMSKKQKLILKILINGPSLQNLDFSYFRLLHKDLCFAKESKTLIVFLWKKLHNV